MQSSDWCKRATETLEVMRHLLSLLIAVVSLGGITKAMTEQDAIGALEGFGDKCEPKPDEQDYKDIIRNTEDPRKSTKCFRHCLMDQMEMLKDCKLDVEKFTELTSMIFEDKEEESMEIGNKCNAEVTCGDKCEVAHILAMCIFKEFKLREWPIPELDEE